MDASFLYWWQSNHYNLITTPPIQLHFFDWYWIFKIKYNGHILNSEWPVVISHQGTWITFVFTIYVRAYWEGFWNPATSKMEHFVTIANSYKICSEGKWTFAIDKYPQVNALKLLHRCFLFLSKTCHVNHALFFIHSCFFQTFVDASWLCRLHTKLLMSGCKNRSYILTKPATFTCRFLNFTDMLSMTFSNHQT